MASKSINVRAATDEDTLEVGTVSGDIQLDRVSNPKVTAKTVNGTVTMSGPLAKSGWYGFTNMTGDIVLAMPHDASFQLNAKVSDKHDIVSDFPLKYSERSAAASAAGRDKTQDPRDARPKPRKPKAKTPETKGQNSTGAKSGSGNRTDQIEKLNAGALRAAARQQRSVDPETPRFPSPLSAAPSASKRSRPPKRPQKAQIHKKH